MTTTKTKICRKLENELNYDNHTFFLNEKDIFSQGDKLNKIALIKEKKKKNKLLTIISSILSSVLILSVLICVILNGPVFIGYILLGLMLLSFLLLFMGTRKIEVRKEYDIQDVADRFLWGVMTNKKTSAQII